MFRKILDTATIVALVLSIAALLSAGGVQLGGNYNGSTSHTFSKFDAAGGFSVEGTTVISSSTAFTATSLSVSGLSSIVGLTNSSGTMLGGGTAITKDGCANKSQTIASLAANTTSTFDIVLSGVSTSSNQVYFLGVATSTYTGNLLFLPRPTSTAGYLTVYVYNPTSSPAMAVTTTTFSACYLQF